MVKPQRFCVRIPAPDTKRIIFLIEVLNWYLKRPQINEKEAEDGPVLSTVSKLTLR